MARRQHHWKRDERDRNRERCVYMCGCVRVWGSSTRPTYRDRLGNEHTKAPSCTLASSRTEP